MRRVYPTRDNPQTLSLYLWEVWLGTEPQGEFGAILPWLVTYFGDVTSWQPAHHLYAWAIGLLSGHLTLAQIPAHAHYMLEQYLRTPSIRATVEGLIEGKPWLTTK